jgi:hypothetical protein
MEPLNSSDGELVTATGMVQARAGLILAQEVRQCASAMPVDFRPLESVNKETGSLIQEIKSMSQLAGS